MVPPFPGSNLAAPANFEVVDIKVIFVVTTSRFYRELAGFPGDTRKPNCGRDGFTPDLGHGRHENLSGAISGFTFLARLKVDWAIDGDTLR
jgi:hypothetical protein